MQTQQFIEILFAEEVQPEDLEIIAPASTREPGRVRLDQAQVGRPNPAAPNSAPLLSRTGAKIGFVASAHLIEPPFTSCYWIEPGENHQPPAQN